MKFKNRESGNVVSTDNPVTIKLMQESSTYEAIPEAKVEKKTKKK